MLSFPGERNVIAFGPKLVDSSRRGELLHILRADNTRLPPIYTISLLSIRGMI